MGLEDLSEAIQAGFRGQKSNMSHSAFSKSFIHGQEVIHLASSACEQSLTQHSIQGDLTKFQENLETQAALATQEKDQLRSLHQSRGVEQTELAVVEKVDQSISRMYVLASMSKSSVKLAHENRTHLEGKINDMRKYIERLESQRNVPTGFASCWKQEPMKLEDALGRMLLIPLEIVNSWEASFKSQVLSQPFVHLLILQRLLRNNCSSFSK
jgi:hypothetical protein